jgi:hypothetical protein
MYRKYTTFCINSLLGFVGFAVFVLQAEINALERILNKNLLEQRLQ